MKIAFYKGNQKGYKGLFNRLIKWWLNGPYSHCEVVFSDGLCASSSFTDGGVRFKQIDLNPAKWDLIEIAGDEATVRQWFVSYEDTKYDLWGALGFVYRATAGSRRRVFCSEVIMLSLGYTDSWRFDPCLVFHVLSKQLKENG